MKVTGIICEFNPFHEGHKYLIENARQQLNSDYVVCIMSGDFVQRGEPAIFDKYTRTKAALDGGADLVFELPVRYSISSAGDFAYGGVKALSALPFVTDLYFGSEWGDIALFEETANALLDESDSFTELLKKYTSQGLSFPAAREKALMEAYSLSHSLLEDPNNTLGVEYCLSLKKLRSHIEPHTIKRQGQGYHETGETTSFPSATAIREQIVASDEEHLCFDDFSDVIAYELRKNNNLSSIKDISEELSNRFANHLNSFTSATSFTCKCQTRIFTEGRIRRALLQTLIDLQKTDYSMPYLRLLGMKKTASHLLKQATDCQILNRLAIDVQKLSDDAKLLIHQDLLASDLYRMTWNQKYQTTLPNEYQQSPIIL